ncbi:MAG TPA: xanthine dehydrogenase accessory protein XdhC, partial [Telluria sp.]|nr:xanthine dehydrogenase accessory protein XdhC [Telluria sp.]
MEDWLSAKCDGPAVLVTVAIVEGSGPREPGAKMLVDGAHQYGTIGGGHLELRAVEVAREMLAGGPQRRLERFALGPSLGQCCGGVVHLAFEIVDEAHVALLRERRDEDMWRLVALDGEPQTTVVPAQAGTHAECAGQPHMQALLKRAMGSRLCANDGCLVLQEQDGRRWLVDLIAIPRNHLILFGAGHVGAAIVRALADVPCRITWVDEREDMFPASVPPNVTVEATDTPEAIVAHAPRGASYLVMTHSH